MTQVNGDELEAEGPIHGSQMNHLANHPGYSITLAAFRLKMLEDEVYRIARANPNRVKIVSVATFASRGRENTGDMTWYFAMSAVLHQAYYSAGEGMTRIERMLLRHEGFQEADIGQGNGFGSWMKTSHLTLSMCNAIAELNISDTRGFQCT